MRRIKNVLLVLFTLTLVVVGAVMPFAASRLQDAQQAGAEIRSFDSFVLTLEKKGELSQILRFLSENNYSYSTLRASTDLPYEPRLSEAEASEMAMEAVALLGQYGLISQEQMKAALTDKPEVRPLVVLSEPNMQASYIIWNVDWVNVNIGIDLDDASGKAYYIGAAYFWYSDGEQYDNNIASTGMSKEYFYVQMENWGKFLEAYYEVTLQDIEEQQLLDSGGKRFWLYIDLDDGGDWLPMRLYLREDGAALSPIPNT